ncbi:hypothetical protein LOAG_14279, partial [Loa loa]
DRWSSEYFSNDFDILDHCDLELMLGTDMDTYNSEITGCDGNLNNDILFNPLRILEYIRLMKMYNCYNVTNQARGEHFEKDNEQGSYSCRGPGCEKKLSLSKITSLT